MLRAGAGRRVLCEVRDRNTVIAAEDRARIFAPLERAATGLALPGHGLGLAFRRIAVEAHGGTIAVAPNQDAVGNCFTFDLPAAPEA